MFSTLNSQFKALALKLPCFNKMENAPFWLTLTLVLLNFVVKFAHKFILESNCLIKTLISPFTSPSKIPQTHSVSCSVFDKEEDGGYDVSNLMEKMGLSFSPEEEAKTDEVSRIFEEREPSIEELRAAFDVFDQNRDGFIDEFELKRVVEILGLGKGFSLGACKRMIRAFDEDGDDRIGSDEFIGIMRRSLC